VLVPALFTGSYALAVWAYLRELRPVSGEVRRAFGEMNAHVSEAIDGIEVVKGHAQEAQEVERFSTNASAFRDAFVQQGDIEARYLPLLLLGLAEAGAFLHSLTLFRQGALDLGGMGLAARKPRSGRRSGARSGADYGCERSTLVASPGARERPRPAERQSFRTLALRAACATVAAQTSGIAGRCRDRN